MTTMVWGESIQVLLGIGVPANPFTLGTSVLGGTNLIGGDPTADVTSYIQSLNINRGRSDNFANFPAGSCSIVLNNTNRIFDPVNTASPYYNSETGTSGLTPKRDIQILSQGQSLFKGKIQDLDINYDLGGNSTVVITGVDAFADLAAATIQTAYTPSVEKSGIRMQNLLARPEVDLTNPQNIDTGTQDLGAYPVTVGTNALSYANQIAESEFGYFFIEGSGTIRFTQKVVAVFASSIAATFSDSGSDLPYTSLGITYGSEQLNNKVIASIPSGTPQIADDTDSQATYGIFSLDLTDLLLATNAQALTLAQSIVDSYAQPLYRFDDISLMYNGLSGANQTILSQLELSDFITVTRNFGVGTPSSLTQTVRCEAIKHSITAGQHRLELRLSPALLVYPFLLGSSTLDTSYALS
jgi:hypothetical protein